MRGLQNRCPQVHFSLENDKLNISVIEFYTNWCYNTNTCTSSWEQRYFAKWNPWSMRWLEAYFLASCFFFKCWRKFRNICLISPVTCCPVQPQALRTNTATHKRWDNCNNNNLRWYTILHVCDLAPHDLTYGTTQSCDSTRVCSSTRSNKGLTILTPGVFCYDTIMY